MVLSKPQGIDTGDSSRADALACRLVHEIAQALVEDGSPIVVDAITGDGLSTLRVQTDADGLGRLVGNQGRTVRAIRTILTSFASKSHRVYGLDIVELTTPTSSSD